MTFRINRVYTRSGDDGKTALVGGERVPKNHPRVWCYGEIDELNSALGCLKEELGTKSAELRPVIEYLQQELFDLGSELATATDYDGMWKTGPAHVKRLEELCDQFGDSLPELTSFILPGGSTLAGWCHLARCIARRAERRLAELLPEGLNPETLKYLNRLSDLLFILARWSLAQEGKDAPLWKQERDRKPPPIQKQSGK